MCSRDRGGARAGAAIPGQIRRGAPLYGRRQRDLGGAGPVARRLDRARGGGRHGRHTMNLLIALAAVVALAQAPPPTKAEQFQDAARKGDAAAVKKLLDEGVDVNTKFRYNATALFYACDHGHVEVVKVLLDRGAAMDLKDTFYGFTPLMLATRPAPKNPPQKPRTAH